MTCTIFCCTKIGWRRITRPAISSIGISRPPEIENPFVSGPKARGATAEDRKSTRLNSSHLVISYAVFCLKKKTSACVTIPVIYTAQHIEATNKSTLDYVALLLCVFVVIDTLSGSPVSAVISDNGNYSAVH